MCTVMSSGAGLGTVLELHSLTFMLLLGTVVQLSSLGIDKNLYGFTRVLRGGTFHVHRLV